MKFSFKHHLIDTNLPFGYYGQPVATKVQARGTAPVGRILRLGVPGNGGQPCVGAMDELEVWNYRLSDAELAAHLRSLRGPQHSK